MYIIIFFSSSFPRPVRSWRASNARILIRYNSYPHRARRHITTLRLHGTMGVAWSLDFTIITVVGSPRTLRASSPWAFRRPGCLADRYRTSSCRGGFYCASQSSQVEILQEPAAAPVQCPARRLSRPIPHPPPPMLLYRRRHLTGPLQHDI